MSYSDFMMQLVCLFILLYSVSSIDTSKAVPLAQRGATRWAWAR
jgi:flagellar motor protein MotB